MSTERLTPVPRIRVAAATAAAFLLLAGTVLLADMLRHPLPHGGPRVPELPGGDPRDPVECPVPLPREGQERRRTPGVAARGGVDVTSNELYDCPEVFDGALVRYRGEVVGGVLARRQGAWVHLNDDVYSGLLGPLPTHRDYRGGNAGVGVFLRTEDAEAIAWVGGPRTRGDLLEITGRFRRVEPGSREVAVIVAEQVAVSTPGGFVETPLLPDRQVAGLVLAAIALALVGTERYRMSRR